jgi:branched-chain amino acid transport system substrate-binding protein
MSPTATADELARQDDPFFRLYPTCDLLMGHLARYMHDRRGLERPAIIVDDVLGSHGSEMATDFAKAYALAGSSPVGVVRYSSANGASPADVAQQALASGPGCILILAGPHQTAMVCQYLKRAGCRVPLATTEHAANEDLLNYGGAAVEGLFFYHTFDRHYPSERYVSFRQRFRRRFGREPGFVAVHAYDAARVVLTAIAEKQPRTELRHAISEMHFFEGVQGRFAISEAGDVRRELFLVTIRNGAYRAME